MMQVFKKSIFFLIILLLSCSTSVFSQSESFFVKGVVTDSENEPLIGVAVVVVDGSARTTTNLGGEYILNAQRGAIIRFSFMGFETREITWDGISTLNVTLKENEEILKEVVVVGAYGTAQKRSDMVGSAYQINAKEIETLPVGRMDNLLEGMIPGLQVSPNSDNSASTKSRLNLRVRGEGSMSASNEPMWIIDGNVVYTGDRTNMVPGMSISVSPTTYLNPEDIESMTVLKDASATSIYGANGANGVILITTKKGSKGHKTSISAQSGVSFINKSTSFKVLNAEEYLMLAKEAYVNSGRDMKYFPFQDNALNSYSTTNTDWMDVFYDQGLYNNVNLSMNGGTDNVRYFVTGAYYNNKSTVIGNDQSRISLRTNFDVAITNKLSFSLRNTASYNTNNIFVPGNRYFEYLPIYSPYNFDRTFRLYNQIAEQNPGDGSVAWNTVRFLNVVPQRTENDHIQRTLLYNIVGSLKYDILRGLTSTTQLGADYQNSNEDRYSAQTNWSGMSTTSGPIGYSYRNNSSILSWSAIQRFNFNQTFGNHNLNGILGLEAKSNVSRTMGAQGSGFINDMIKEVSYAVDRLGTSGRNTTNSLSYFGQVGYAYASKYYLTVNARADGISGFGSEARWGKFGSIGASWNIHSEDFFKSNVIDILKLKASFGSNGNSRIGSQEALGIYSYSESNNYMGNLGATQVGVPNKTLSWETAYITNIGLRAQFFKRFDAELEFYNKQTSNLLSNVDVSRTTGDTRSYRNVGEIVNRGVELTLEALILRNDDWYWKATLNAAHNRNKLTKLYNEISKVMGDYIWREGYDTRTFYVIRWAGVDPRDGNPLWYDADGNITRSHSYDNRVTWHTATPAVTGGFINDLSYKYFSLRTIFSYVIGGYSYSTFGRSVMSDGLNILEQNQSVNQLDRWQKPGDVALTPKLMVGNSTRSVMTSTRHLYKSTHVKFRNIAFDYNLPSNFVKSLHLSSARVGIIADNLLIWTPYDKKGRNSYKQSMSGYPTETTISLSLSANF